MGYSPFPITRAVRFRSGLAALAMQNALKSNSHWARGLSNRQRAMGYVHAVMDIAYRSAALPHGKCSRATGAIRRALPNSQDAMRIANAVMGRRCRPQPCPMENALGLLGLHGEHCSVCVEQWAIVM